MDFVSSLVLSISLISSFSVSSGVPINVGTEEKVDYASENHFSLVDYFENLSEYQPFNSFGSCGFVGISSILTYADTFINDNIVPEKFDRTKENTSFSEATKHSPGVAKLISSQEDYEEEYGNLYDYTIATYDSDFQSYLII